MSNHQAPAPIPSVTFEQMARAFEQWEAGFRANPNVYRSMEQCAEMGVSQVSAERASYFHELLMQQRT